MKTTVLSKSDVFKSLSFFLLFSSSSFFAQHNNTQHTLTQVRLESVWCIFL